MSRTILGTGIFNLDTIVVREYPEGPSRQRVFNERCVLEEIGGTCGNVMTMLSHLGERVFPIARFDDSPEGLRLTGASCGTDATAGGQRGKGTLVYFEPSHMESRTDLECVACSDIVKFSNQNIPDTDFTDAFGDKLFIQTLGTDGLRFNLRGEGWVTLPPVRCERVVDWEGAGDWTTSMLIHGLCARGILSMDAMTRENITEVLQNAQEVASRSIAYLGSKGIIHAGKI